MTRGRSLGVLLLAPLLLAGCGSSGDGAASVASKEKQKEGVAKAADTQTCVADAKPYTGSTPAGFPTKFPRPDGAVLFNVEDRGADGVISTAVVKASLRQVLEVYNTEAQRAGFTITGGETEKRDAEANWEGNGFRGRWALRESATCTGEVVVQLLSEKS